MLRTLVQRLENSRPAAALRAGVRRFPAAVIVVAGFVTVLQGAAIAASQWGVHRLLAGLPSIADVRRMGEMAQATVFYDAADAPAFTIFDERRFDVSLADVSPHLVQALLAIEDQRFRTHGGVDVVRIAGATLANLREGRLAQGGSTITQQLARQSFLTLDKTYTRKVQEVLLAVRIERQYTKDQILELYLNKMYFGAGLYGAEAAALGYFGKPARELTVAESALLAGLVKSPSTWAPTVNMERAVARRNVVLQAMRDEGDIDEATFDRRARQHGDAARRAAPRRAVWPVLQGAGAAGADRALRPRTRLPGRPARLHDHRRRDAEGGGGGRREGPRRPVDAACGGAQGPQARRAGRRRAAAGGAGRPRPAQRPRAGHRRRPQLQREPLQPRRAGQATAGLGVQALRLRGRARERLHAGQPDRPPR